MRSPRYASILQLLLASLLLTMAIPAQAVRDDVLIVVNDNSRDSALVGGLSSNLVFSRMNQAAV